MLYNKIHNYINFIDQIHTTYPILYYLMIHFLCCFDIW